ncbi:rhodanese-like domain-containing protein [Bacillus tianshenii]|nr:rhodanese-like domain-containing protein [Bacillus tianshenii]
MVPAKGVKQATTADLQTMLKDKQKRQYLDVRTPGEYKGNHIKQFQNLPLHQIKQNAASLHKDEEVVVICQSGMRSMQAAKALKKAGFQQITNIQGGMSAWNNR